MWMFVMNGDVVRVLSWFVSGTAHCKVVYICL